MEIYHIPKSQLAALNSIFGIYDITHFIMPEAINIRSSNKRRICKIKEFYRNMHSFRQIIIHLHIQIYQILVPFIPPLSNALALSLSPHKNKINVIIADISPPEKKILPCFKISMHHATCKKYLGFLILRVC